MSLSEEVRTLEILLNMNATIIRNEFNEKLYSYLDEEHQEKYDNTSISK